LSPGDSLHLSVSTPRPVNILVLDEEGMESFYRTDPVSANIQNRTVEAVHRGYKYGDISPGNGEIFHEDLSLETEAFVRIPEVSKYYVVIDPRFSYEFTSIGGYPSSYTEDFISAKVYIEVFREGSALYWKKFADSQLRKGEYVSAEANYRRSLDLDSGNPDTWYNYGIVLRDLGRYREAIAAFNETLTIQPGDADVWEKIGVLYLMVENEAAARDAYNRSRAG
ncbi:MAG: tetratricopeptide repeat protein, partial [Methanoregulaceae archaeon]|nr:tetratricopeptide repeat protein [Methanoregulaceae archaeon]